MAFTTSRVRGRLAAGPALVFRLMGKGHDDQNWSVSPDGKPQRPPRWVWQRSAPLLGGALALFVLVSCALGTADSATDLSVECSSVPGFQEAVCEALVQDIGDMTCAEIEPALPREHFRRHVPGGRSDTADVAVAAYEERAKDIGCVIDTCRGLEELLDERTAMVEQGIDEQWTVDAVHAAQIDQGCS